MNEEVSQYVDGSFPKPTDDQLKVISTLGKKHIGKP